MRVTQFVPTHCMHNDFRSQITHIPLFGYLRSRDIK